MNKLLRALGVVYAIGFVLILALNLSIGPVTPALALSRAAVWPAWIATGWPHGVPLTMDCPERSGICG